MRQHIQKNSSSRIEYVDIVNAETLETFKTLKGRILIAVATYFGKTRLIDNIAFTLK